MNIFARLGGPILFVTVAAATVYGLSTTRADPATGLPQSSTPPPPNPVTVANVPGIALWEPLAEATEIPIGGFLFLVPAGATAVEVVQGPPVVDAMTGERLGLPSEHRSYWLISRNQSVVKIDSGTAEMFQWEVQPEDATDFTALQNPRPKS